MIAARAASTADLAAALADALGGVCTDPAARAAVAIGGRVPAIVAAPADGAALAAAVARVAATGHALVPLGHGAHRALGHAPERYDVALGCARLDRVLDYAPADMTVTVEAGVTLAALQELLAREGQWLPLEVPLPSETTIGGLVAADLGGPLRASQGRVRDFLIGVGFVTADGRAARAGGQVVKNVAGYDLMKLLTGSLGTLAVVRQATFKVRPRPALVRSLALAPGDVASALALAEDLATSGVAPLAATVVLECDGSAPPLVLVRLGGVEADVAAARLRLLDLAARSGAEVVLGEAADEPAALALAVAVRDFVRAAPGEVVVRLPTLPRQAGAVTAAVLRAVAGHAGRCLLDPRSGDVALAVETAEPAATIAALAVLAAGHGARLVVERWPVALAATIEVWRPLPAALPLMRRVKTALDPQGVLAPGRFVGRL